MNAPMNAVDLLELERDEIEALLAGLEAPAFHGRQVFHWLWARGTTDLAEMTDLSTSLRSTLAESCRIGTLHVEDRQISEDGTTKFLLRLGDERRVEAVYIPDTPAQTFCVSTQVGCAMGCTFCLTGKMGLVRNLTAGEIAGQVLVLAKETGLLGSTFNVVLMGMGEPLHNYDATTKALRILADYRGLAIPQRRVTLSTVGLVPELERLTRERVMPNLAVSLHATTDELRTELVPVNRKYGLAELVETCRRLPLTRRQRITFEYVLLEGVNDQPEDARRLVRLLAGLNAKVNLLALNEAPGIEFKRPDEARVNAFAKTLAERGLTVSVRKSRGRDIRAACGQLLVEGERRSTGEKVAARLS
jgi:23S rRNA (adenine2503-C2)-methyltransferase